MRDLPVKVKHTVHWINTPHHHHNHHHQHHTNNRGKCERPLSHRAERVFKVIWCFLGMSRRWPAGSFKVLCKLSVWFTHSLPFSKCVYSPIIFPLCVCVCVYHRQCGVLLQSRPPPPFAYCEGNSVPCVCGFQGAFKENKAQRPHSPSTTPPKRPPQLLSSSSSSSFSFSLPHSLTPCGTFSFFFFYGVSTSPFSQTSSSNRLVTRANFVCSL